MKNIKNKEIEPYNNIQGGFFNWPPRENVSRLAPPKNASTGPPKSVKYENHIEVLRHLDFFRSWVGPVWDSNAFWKLVTYRPILSKFKGGPNTLYFINVFGVDDLVFGPDLTNHCFMDP